ncbi:MAG: MurR/RpiR family transcriptional regulator [Bacteroidota bacterium]
MANDHIPESIRHAYGQLNPAEKKLADYIIEHKREVIHLSITELAERSGVSETTVIRFCRHLGFEGYQVFKISMAQDMVPPLSDIHEDLEEGDDPLSVTKKVFAANIAAIRDTLSILDQGLLERAIDVLVKAKRIVFVGEGGSGIVAKDAEHKFIRTGIPVLASSDPFMEIATATLLGTGDVMVGISHSGSTKSTVQAVAQARQAGATTICITQYQRSPITRVSDIVLPVVSKEVAVRSEATGSRIAQLCLIDSLYVGVAHRIGEKASQNIRRIREAQVSLRF